MIMLGTFIWHLIHDKGLFTCYYTRLKASAYYIVMVFPYMQAMMQVRSQEPDF